MHLSGASEGESSTSLCEESCPTTPPAPERKEDLVGKAQNPQGASAQRRQHRHSTHVVKARDEEGQDAAQRTSWGAPEKQHVSPEKQHVSPETLQARTGYYGIFTKRQKKICQSKIVHPAKSYLGRKQKRNSLSKPKLEGIHSR